MDFGYADSVPDKKIIQSQFNYSTNGGFIYQRYKCI